VLEVDAARFASCRKVLWLRSCAPRSSSAARDVDQVDAAGLCVSVLERQQVDAAMPKDSTDAHTIDELELPFAAW
jgi:hypothetical protein